MTIALAGLRRGTPRRKRVILSEKQTYKESEKRALELEAVELELEKAGGIYRRFAEWVKPLVETAACHMDRRRVLRLCA